jgi:hypothetical protein
MSKLLISETPLQVLPTLATRIGLNEAIFIQQLHWMSQQDHYGRVDDGRKWIRNSLPDWHKQFPFFSVAALRRIIKNLQDDGLLLYRDDLNRHAYDKTGWYAVDIGAFEKIDGLVERLAEINQKRKEAISSRYEGTENEEAEEVSLQDEPRATPLQNVTPHLQNVTPLQNVAEGITKCKGGGYKMITTIPKTSSKISSKKHKDQHQHQHTGEVGKIDVDDVDGAGGNISAVPSDVATAATAIAEWMGFTGNIAVEMQQHDLTLAALLAWAFWVKVEGGRCRNPVGVCRSKWTGNGRHGPSLPPARWLELARAWLDLDDNGRLEMLSTGGQSHLLSYEFPYPDVLPAFRELFRVTQGDSLPDALLPDRPDGDYAEPDNELPTHDVEVDNSPSVLPSGQRIAEVDELWELLLYNERSPAFKTWLKSTTLLVDGRSAVIQVANSYAADWVNNSLLETIKRNWKILTRHTGQEWADLAIVGAVEAAQLVAA